MNKELLRREICLIKDEGLRSEVERILDGIPECMEHKPASSSGKYHPEFATGDGGLVRHTKAVVKVMELIVDAFCLEPYPAVTDAMYAACILHDMKKYGDDPDNTDHTVHEHPILMAKELNEKYWNVSLMVACHMGRYNKSEHSDVILPKPTETKEKLVHLADLIASKKWVSEKILE